MGHVWLDHLQVIVQAQAPAGDNAEEVKPSKELRGQRPPLGPTIPVTGPPWSRERIEGGAVLFIALWTLVIVAAGFFVACFLDDLLDPNERESATTQEADWADSADSAPVP